MDYNQLREILVNSENLYTLWKSSKISEKKFIKNNASLIEETEKARLTRELTKARQVRFLERQKAEGKKQLTMIISGESYELLTRLRDRAIHAGDKKSLGDVLDELVLEHTKAGLKPDPVQAIADQIVEDIEEHVQEHPSSTIVETQKEIFNDDSEDSSIEAMWKCREAGMSWAETVEKLNRHGIATAKGKTWTVGAARSFYSRNK